MPEDTFNIAAALATCRPGTLSPGVIFPAGRDRRGRAITTQVAFGQLNALCDGYAHGLSDLGIRKGDRVLMLVQPGVDLIAVSSP